MRRPLLLSCVLVVAACGGGDGTAAPGATTTTTTSATSSSTSTTTDGDAWFDLLDPVPDVPAEPPPLLAAITDDGRLVVVDTTTGEELRELDSADDPRAEQPVEGSLHVFDEVDVAPDGATVWYSACCEPAGGNTYRAAVAGGEPERVGEGYDPTSGAGSRFVAAIEIFGATIRDAAGDLGKRWWHDPRMGEYQEVAWSLDGRTLVVRVGAPSPGELLVLDVAAIPGGAADPATAPQPDPQVLPGSAWTEPTFRRDGRLVVAEQAGDRWAGRVIDVATRELLLEESIDYGGQPIDQDHDPSGGWLLAVVAEPGAPDGQLRWFGPGGSTGAVPGRYRAAAW